MLKSIELTGEQKKVLFLPPQNPIQIKGVAGSGKTTVALYRAKQLIETQDQLFSKANVVIFTFNKTLASYIDAVKRSISTIHTKDGEKISTTSGLDIQVTNFHKWAYSFAKVNNNQVVKPWDQDNFIRAAIQLQKKNTPDNTILDKSLEFFKEEIAWIKGQLFDSETAYIEAERSGRGTADRVTKDHKKAIWGVFMYYKQAMKSQNKIDFDDFAHMALARINSDRVFQAPFSHIVIDEAQDLNKAQILTLSKLVSPDTNSITIIADAAQRIYKSGFSWREVGINVQGGRTLAFKKNYRNTKNIARAAASLLDKESDKTDFTELELEHLKDGSAPKFIRFNSSKEQLSWIASQLSKLGNLGGIAILHRTNKGVGNCVDFLKKAGIPAEKASGQIDYFNNSVKVCTMSSVKGLEFDHVFIIDLNDDQVPFPPGFIDENDEFHISTERRLLYTCMTRARQNLILSCTGVPSRYIDEIDSNLIEKQDLSNPF